MNPAALSVPDAAALFDLPRPAPASRIVVAMSGGVDSSVVAALAHASGAEVIGITLQLSGRRTSPSCSSPSGSASTGVGSFPSNMPRF